jgi:multiple sugar transport system permease protein
VTKRRSPQTLLARATLYAVLIAGSLIMAFPFFWMAITSFQSAQESLQEKPVWLPQRLQPANWFAAQNLGTQGGDGTWGGIAPQKSLVLELRTTGTGDPTAEVPQDSRSNSNSFLFGASSQTADPRQVAVSRAEDGTWRVQISSWN